MDEIITIEIDCVVAMAVIANIQLATRHLENIGASRQLAEQFARELQKSVVQRYPSHGPLLELG